MCHVLHALLIRFSVRSVLHALAGESVVLCVIVDAPGEARPVYIRPNKRSKMLSNGDEEIQLYMGQGDAYDMDGAMQLGYEHW